MKNHSIKMTAQTMKQRIGKWWMLAVLLIPCQTALATISVYEIACEGTESGGGGVSTYQYTLRNLDQSTRTLNLFYLGTDDVNLADYSNWVMPLGWSSQVGTWASFLGDLNVMGTDHVKTPHMVLPPPPVGSTLGAIVFSGPTLNLASLGTATFGFDNANHSEDVEWIAEGVAPPPNDEFTVGTYILPMAGPLGTFTQGFVHSPVPEPSTLLMLGIGALGLWHRRRSDR